MAPSNLNRVTFDSVNNVVKGERLREVQKKVLSDLAEAIIPSMGPAGSNSLVIKGSSEADIIAEYTKDGNKIIKSIKYQEPIEMAIKSEIENATRHIEKVVGDGTSSVVVMAHNIFDGLCTADEEGKLPSNPYETIRVFKDVVAKLSEKIRKKGHECTLEDIYNIAYISTNGNEYIADTLKDIYAQYGMNVFIDVSASTNENTYIKSYDGVTIESGYSDPAMINNLDRHSCIIHSLKDSPIRIYHFAEAIDTPEQLAMFQKIIETNVVDKYSRRMQAIPTVIFVPQISRDAQAYMRRITQMLLQFPESAYSQKPQLLIVTNYIGLNENYIDYISQLCGCTPIKKYIDEKIHKQDQENGLAPTLDNVCDNFFGSATEVEADESRTRVIDPALMYKKDSDGNIVLDENEKPILSDTYNSIVNFIQAQYNSAASQGGNAGTLGSLKRQLNAIRCNMIEIFVGGISISDRDSLRDLVEDAVLNCRSAAKNGVGFGANAMGYNALNDAVIDSSYRNSDIETKECADAIINILYDAYNETIKHLYQTKYDSSTVISILANMCENGIPYNMNTNKYDNKVLTSIESEPMILDTIAKIITIMFTANQAILQTPSLAMHY